MNILEYAMAKKVLGGSGTSAPAVIQPLSVTENGTYTPPDGVDGYSPVTVNVAGGSVGSSSAVLTVVKQRTDTSNGEHTYYREQFIVLDIYPKTNGTVNVTYGDLTKTITDTSGAVSPEPQSVFFGTFNGVTDDIETPESGKLTIEGDYRGFGSGAYTDGKSESIHCYCITGVDSLGDAEIIPYKGLTMFDATVQVTIPTSVRFIDDYSLGATAIDTRTTIMLSTLPPCLGGDDVFGDKTGTRIIVPRGCADIYKNALGWRTYADCITEAEV